MQGLPCAIFLAITWLTMASAMAQESHDFLVPTVTIHAGQTVSDEMLVARKLFANAVAVRAHVTAREQAVGKIAKRAIAMGAAIPLGALREPHVFREGDSVGLSFSSGGLSIRGAGLAMQPGIVGQSVRVRNADTGVVVTGTVAPDGLVKVGGP